MAPMPPPPPTVVEQFDTPRHVPQLNLGLDPLLAIAPIVLSALSVWVIGHATRGDIPGQPHYFLIRQAVYAGAGIALMILLSRIDYGRLREWRLGIYGVTIVFIAAVLALAEATRGSKRWLSLPFFNLQPSELGKLLLIVALSGFVVARVRALHEITTTCRVMLLAVVPAMLVMVQPDLGSGLVYLAIALGTLFVAGTSAKHFAALAALGVTAIVVVLLAAPAIGVNLLKPYQVQRLTAFVNPTDNPREQGYQLQQSTIAIGAGEKTGRGPAGATQTTLDFLPAHQTDFIFAVLGESYGFAGAALVLALYALVMWRILRILTLAKDLYGALIAGGVWSMLAFQVFLNTGMTMGIAPITGVPLPLFSYGGSSVVVTFMALGLVQSVRRGARTAAERKYQS